MKAGKLGQVFVSGVDKTTTEGRGGEKKGERAPGSIHKKRKAAQLSIKKREQMTRR